MVTRERVLKVSELEEIDFDAQLMQYFETEQHSPDEGFYDGVEAFIADFRKEGWCKTELRSIIHTLFHLDFAIHCYGEYWF
jgi:hypothetical protein